MAKLSSPRLQRNFVGQDGFLFFFGVVEDRNDPLKLGRVRVRIFGWHTKDKQKIPTDQLHWAITIQSPDSGRNVVGYKEGDWVFGFFIDGLPAQQPCILGLVPHFQEKEGNSNEGFFDPRGNWSDDSISSILGNVIGNTVNNNINLSNFPNLISKAVSNNVILDSLNNLTIPVKNVINNVNNFISNNISLDTITSGINDFVNHSVNSITNVTVGTIQDCINSVVVKTVTDASIRNVIVDTIQKNSSSISNEVINSAIKNININGLQKQLYRAIINNSNVKAIVDTINKTTTVVDESASILNNINNFVNKDTKYNIDKLVSNVSNIANLNSISKSILNSIDSVKNKIAQISSEGFYGANNYTPADLKKLTDKISVLNNTQSTISNQISTIQNQNTKKTILKSLTARDPKSVNYAKGGVEIEEMNKVSIYPQEEEECENLKMVTNKEQTTSRHCRGDISRSIVTLTKNNTQTGIDVSFNGTWDELSNPATPLYPYNHTYHSEAGHLIEVDDTPGKERLNIFHRSGTFLEVHPDGSQVNKIGNIENKIVCNSSNQFVMMNKNTTVDENYNIRVNNQNFNLHVVNKDYNKWVQSGDKKEIIANNVISSVGNNFLRNIKNSQLHKIGQQNIRYVGNSELIDIGNNLVTTVKNKVYFSASDMTCDIEGMFMRNASTIFDDSYMQQFKTLFQMDSATVSLVDRQAELKMGLILMRQAGIILDNIGVKSSNGLHFYNGRSLEGLFAMVDAISAWFKSASSVMSDVGLPSASAIVGLLAKYMSKVDDSALLTSEDLDLINLLNNMDVNLTNDMASSSGSSSDKGPEIAINAPNGFLWKPSGEGGRGLVVLVPVSWGRPSGAGVYDKDGNLLELANDGLLVSGDHFDDGRGMYRFSKKGENFPMGAIFRCGDNSAETEFPPVRNVGNVTVWQKEEAEREAGTFDWSKYTSLFPNYSNTNGLPVTADTTNNTINNAGSSNNYSYSSKGKEIKTNAPEGFLWKPSSDGGMARGSTVVIIPNSMGTCSTSGNAYVTKDGQILATSDDSLLTSSQKVTGFQGRKMFRFKKTGSSFPNDVVFEFNGWKVNIPQPAVRQVGSNSENTL